MATNSRQGMEDIHYTLVLLFSFILLWIPSFLVSVVKADSAPVQVAFCPPTGYSCDLYDPFNSNNLSFIDPPAITAHLTSNVFCGDFCAYSNAKGTSYPFAQFVPDSLDNPSGPGVCSCYYSCQHGLQVQNGTLVGNIDYCSDGGCFLGCGSGADSTDTYSPPTVDGNYPSFNNTSSPTACLLLCLSIPTAQFYAWVAGAGDGTTTYRDGNGNFLSVFQYGDCYCYGPDTDCYYDGDYEEYPITFVRGQVSLGCQPTDVASLPGQSLQPISISCDSGSSNDLSVKSSTGTSLTVRGMKYTCTLRNPSSVLPVSYPTLSCTNFQPYVTDQLSSRCQVQGYIPPGGTKTFSYTNPLGAGPASISPSLYPYPSWYLAVVNAFTALPVSVSCKDMPAFSQRGVEVLLTFTCTLTNQGPSAVRYAVFTTTIAPLTVSGINKDFTFTAGLGPVQSKTFSFSTFEGQYTLTLVSAGNQLVHP